MSKIIGIGGRGSFYKKIAQANGFKTTGFSKVDVYINYGSTEEPMNTKASCVKLNCVKFPNKYIACMKVADESDGVVVPQVQLSPPFKKQKDQWIVKPLRSFAGKNIVAWDGGPIPDNFYFQKRVPNRRYELRVHAFEWMDPDKWVVQKRTHPEGEGQLTWNHHTGGYFTTINQEESNNGVFTRAKDSANEVLACLGYDFGAVDFIVSNDDKPLVPYFIEINAAPGFSIDHMVEYYINAFSLLKEE